MTQPLKRQTGPTTPDRKAPTPGLRRAQLVAAATRRAEIRRQQDRDILRQIQR